MGRHKKSFPLGEDLGEAIMKKNFQLITAIALCTFVLAFGNFVH